MIAAPVAMFHVGHQAVPPTQQALVLEQRVRVLEGEQEALRARYGGGMGAMPVCVRRRYDAREGEIRALRQQLRAGACVVLRLAR